MEIAKTIEDYDNELFFIFRFFFAKVYPDKFSNEKLFNSWGKKGNFVIKTLKNIIRKDKKYEKLIGLIDALIDLLSEKNNKGGLQYFSSFDYKIYKNHIYHLLYFRNAIANEIFSLIAFEEKNIYDKIRDSFMEFFVRDDFKFLSDLFELAKYSLNKNANVIEDFFHLINNEDIMTKLISNIHCSLNTRQMDFILSNEYDINEGNKYLNDLKALEMTNDEWLEEIKNTKSDKKAKNKKKNKKKETTQMKSNDANSNPGHDEKQKNKIHQSDNKDNKDNENQKDNKDIKINTQDKIQPYMEENVNNKNISEENSLIKKENECLLTKIDELTKALDSKDTEIKKLRKKLKEDKIEVDNLKTKNEVLELKINMISYRDLIKDIINESFIKLGCSDIGIKYLSDKVNRIKYLLSSSVKNFNLNKGERILYSQFLSLSYITHKNLNYNIHEGLYVHDYSIKNFLKCLEEYSNLFIYEILDESEFDKVQEYLILSKKSKEIQDIIDKLGIKYDDDFKY